MDGNPAGAMAAAFPREDATRAWRARTVAALAGVSALALAVNAIAASGLTTLPSPLYGGDYWYQLGQTGYVARGGDPRGAASLLGTRPGYLPLYGAVAGWWTRLAGLSPIDGELTLSYAVAALGAALLLALGWAVAGRCLSGVIAAATVLATMQLPVLKYTDFTRLGTVPLVLLLLWRFWERRRAADAVLLGLGYGLVGLSHGVAFTAVSLLLAAGAAAHLASAGLHRDPGAAIRAASQWTIVALVGVPVALVWWWDPVFVHGGRTSPHYLEWNAENWASAAHRLEFARALLASRFANGTSPATALRSGLALAGVVAVLRGAVAGSVAARFATFLLGSALALSLHVFATEPLAAWHFLPNYVAYLLLDPTLAVISGLGAARAATVLARGRPALATLVLAAMAVAGCGSAVAVALARRADPLVARARSEGPPEHLTDLARWLDAHAPLDAVVLTNKELGFALNAVTARKLVVSRRAQTDPFVPVDGREIDAAVALYGADPAARLEVLRRHGVRYVYWERAWIPVEFQVEGGELGMIDPLLVFDTPEHRARLAAAGISLLPVNTWVDPDMKGDAYRTFDLLVVMPENYARRERPWTPQLDPLLRSVWRHEAGGETVAELYEVQLP
ncbi:MAG TPA: hypothetical protein VFP65_10750 [Anaeromyxobacteraceae bacterium]|nr:hypothetical protein [Anaeromyxobacteraceae bacterium]